MGNIINNKSTIGGQSIHGDVHVKMIYSTKEVEELNQGLEELKKLILDSTESAEKKAIAVTEIDAAIVAKDVEEKTNHLKKVGYWVLDFAKELGTGIASSYIKKALGMP